MTRGLRFRAPIPLFCVLRGVNVWQGLSASGVQFPAHVLTLNPGGSRMDKEKLGEYKRAIDELHEAVELLRSGTSDRAAADEKYQKSQGAVRQSQIRAFTSTNRKQARIKWARA
jgi:hypothetical protein